jgi:glycosyltransferase EpsD
LREESFDLIHCHTPVGGILTRLAARRCRKKGTTVIYTAHGFHFYAGAPFLNWLLFYPIEKLCSRWTDILITINHEDYRRAKKYFHAKRIVYIPGVGIDLVRFQPGQGESFITKQALGIPETARILLSVGELSDRKNHVTVIRALAGLPENIHYVIAGAGDREQNLRETAAKLGIADRVHLLGLRTDVPELLHTADIYLLPSIQEGLNVSLMEAMASGLPCICSDIRGNEDLIVEGKGGYRVASTDVEAWSGAIERMLGADRTRMGEYNAAAVKQFSLDEVEKRMRGIYTC